MDGRKGTDFLKKRYLRVIAVMMLSALLLQCFPLVFMGKPDAHMARKASAENTEIHSARDSIEIHDGESGEITADSVMPDLIFKPEEDGAWVLELHMEKKKGDIFPFSFMVYEWQYDNCWERIDFFNGPGAGSLDDGTTLLRALIPQYYRKGHTYKIRFYDSADLAVPQEDLPELCRYTFQKTDLAGCCDGVLWRTGNHWAGYDGQDTATEDILCTGYIGNETILRIPDRIEGHLVSVIGCTGGFYSISNEHLQVLVLGEGVVYIGSLGECRNLKDLYSYNRDCVLMNQVLPKIYMGGGNWYYDTVIHGYAGGGLEEDCLEKGYSFEALPEAPSPSPVVTESPGPATASPAFTESPGPATASPSVSATLAPPETSSRPTKEPPLLPIETSEPEISPAPTEETTPLPSATLALPETPSRPTKTPDSAAFSPDAPGTFSPHPGGSAGSMVKQTAKPSPVSLLAGLKASTDHYTGVTLTWKAVSGTSYQIFRSLSRDSGYKRLKKGITQTRYKDTSVKSGKSYYYLVQAVKTAGNQQRIQAEARTKRIKIRAFARPVVQIRRKQSGGIRYLWIRLKKYQGKRIEIYYKDSRWASYRKVKLYENRIQKQKRIFRIQCMSAKTLYLKIRTYGRKKGKKVYSLYTRPKKLDIK